MIENILNAEQVIMIMKKTVLLIEDENVDHMSLKQLVNKNSTYTYVVAMSISEAKAILESEDIGVVITNYLLSDGTALDIFSMVGETPIIIVTDGSDVEVAVKAMKAGAYDYIIKDPELAFLKFLPSTIENALQHKESKDKIRLLESAVVNANDAIIILEAEPGRMPGRRILYVNEAFTRMTGYTMDDAVNKTLKILRGPRTNLDVLKRIRIALDNIEPIRVEIISYRKDGSEFWSECNIVPFADETGAFRHWVSVQRDITDRKKAEEEREILMKEIEIINTDLSELNRELETIGAERTMSLMALTVADRIRNPASMIGGRCRRILQKEELSENLKENIGYIVEGAEKLDKIVKDFETLLKNKESKFKNEDINKVVERVVSVIEKEAEYKGIRMTVKISSESLRIKMQKDLLRVAIYHIMKNALEATCAGGEISVETLRDGEYVVLNITDSGYGIPSGDVENIFRAFFSTKEHGFGMGLPLVKQIVSEHLGELLVQSKPESGTTFKIRFPVRWKEDSIKVE